MATAVIKPIYVLHGGDAFLRDAHRQEIVAHIVGDADPQVCVTVFDADAEKADVFDELRTIPFLAPRRAVVLRDADAFVSAHREALEEYFRAPSENSSMVLIVNSWPSNTRIAKLVKQIGETVDCTSPEAGAVPSRVAAFAKQRGKTISRQAAELLAQCVGQELSLLDAEVEKLSLYVGDREQITPEDVSAIVTSTAGPGAFDLTNAITAGDTAAALKALDGVLGVRGDEFKTLGSLAWHLRRVLQAHRQVASGKGMQVRMPPAQQRAFTAMLQRRPIGRVREDFRKMLRADLGMKSGQDAKAALQELVIGLCS